MGFLKGVPTPIATMLYYEVISLFKGIIALCTD